MNFPDAALEFCTNSAKTEHFWKRGKYRGMYMYVFQPNLIGGTDHTPLDVPKSNNDFELVLTTNEFFWDSDGSYKTLWIVEPEYGKKEPQMVTPTKETIARLSIFATNDKTSVHVLI